MEASDEMVGASPAICAVFDLIRKVATTEMPVLLTGETGTGKEITAQAIHARSLRKDGPFIPINCGAITENLLESELFGHERGAFTGAVNQKRGKLEAASEGTLFLDEVGDLLPALQVKLLRFLQEGTFERVGGQKTLHVAARDLEVSRSTLYRKLRTYGLEKFVPSNTSSFAIIKPIAREQQAPPLRKVVQ